MAADGLRDASSRDRRPRCQVSDGPHALSAARRRWQVGAVADLRGRLAVTLPPDTPDVPPCRLQGRGGVPDCLDLPHVVGSVTDLDGRLVERVLVSLGAELAPRARAGCCRCQGPRAIWNGRLPTTHHRPSSSWWTSSPRCDRAPRVRRGRRQSRATRPVAGHAPRAATQRPAGVINDRIRANTNLRISLRMNDVGDSDDVINSPAAAQLPRDSPGRAYVRNGSTELVEVQVGFGGGLEFAFGQTLASPSRCVARPRPPRSGPSSSAGARHRPPVARRHDSRRVPDLQSCRA